jgi:pimeloyl-ACP methyl ester carboxylesterase
MTMIGRRALVAFATVGATAASSRSRLGARVSADTAENGYAPVNGLQMYYEIHGEGAPLLLLHSAFGTIAGWGPVLEGLAATRQVIAVELQGHGHTADIDRPLSFEQMADDVAALLNHLSVEQVDIVGHSMGANTALQVAMRHPQRVRKLVAISPNYRSDGEYDAVREGVQMLTPEFLAGSPMEQIYLDAAPNPNDFPMLVEKLKTLLGTEYAWPEADLQAIAAPTQILIGDSDTVRPEHAVELFRLVGGGVPGDLAGLPTAQLAILPAITHATIVAERVELPLAMIEAFLAAPMPDAA